MSLLCIPYVCTTSNYYVVYSVQVQVQVNTELTREWILDVLIDGGQTNPSTEDLRGPEGLLVLPVLVHCQLANLSERTGLGSVPLEIEE